MRAVFFVSHLDSGGIENYLLRFLQFTQSKIKKVYVYCKSGKDGQLESQYLTLNNVELVKKRLGYLDISTYRVLERFFKDNNIDVVCDFTGDFSGRILSSAKKCGINKRVAFYRSASNSFDRTFLRNVYCKWVHSLTINNATDILSNSKAAFDFFFREDWRIDDRFKVVYNGLNIKEFTKVNIDLRDQLSIPKDAFVVGHTGRLNPAKNHETILEVAARLLRKHDDIYFILCGNGVKEKLQGSSVCQDYSDRVLLFENRSDIPHFLNTMDCYFFPSVREGQPNALIEAMLVGLPYVASDIKPIVETVGSTEYLFDPKDITAFVASIENIYERSKNEQMRAPRPDIEKRFDANVQFNKFYSVLTTINISEG